MKTTSFLNLSLCTAAMGAALVAWAAPVTQDGPVPGLENPTTGLGLPSAPTVPVQPQAIVRPAGTAASQPLPASTSNMGPTPDSATGALLEEMRQRAGIPAPGVAMPASAPTARRGAAPLLQNGQPNLMGELDPELKEALKEARDLAKEGLSGVTGQEAGLTPASQVPAGGLSGPGSANPSGEGADAENDPAVRRAELAATQPEAPARPREATGPMTLIPDLIQAVRDLLLHPATWLAVALLLLLKLAWALAATRSRRSVHRRRRSRQTARPGPNPATRVDASPAAPPSGLASSDRLDRSSRHGQRQRRQQR